MSGVTTEPPSWATSSASADSPEYNYADSSVAAAEEVAQDGGSVVTPLIKHDDEDAE